MLRRHPSPPPRTREAGWFRRAPILCLTLLALGARPARAQTYEVRWWTVDGGGHSALTAGIYTIAATAGQPDASSPLAGSPYSVSGGFWPGAGAFDTDLSLVLSDSPDPVAGASTLTYTIAVSNAGPVTANQVSVSHTLPGGVAFVSAGGTGWTCGESGGVVTCARPDVALGAAPNITVQVSPGPAGAVLVSTAGVSAAEADPNPLDNSDSETTTVTAILHADLGVQKLGPSAPVLWGQPVTYTITVTNAGPDAVLGATVTDTFPAAVQAVSWTCVPAGGASCAPAGSGHLSDTVNLPSGGTVTYTATGLLSYGTMLPVFNTATVASPLFDPLLANNSSTAATPVDPDLIFKDGFE